MIFTEPRFLLFFVVVLAVHWTLRGPRARKAFLLLVSYAFYAAWDWRYLSLIVASTLADYVAARRIEAAPRGTPRRRAWLLISLGVNLGLLGTFKYFNFFSESLEALLVSFGMDASLLRLDVVLPVGISFYTFQTLSYTLDVWFGRLRARRSLLDVALFVGFFPQLVAGPIVRAIDFLPQLDGPRRWAAVRVRPCLVLFLVGFVKKACISDNVAPLVDEVFSNPAAYTATSQALAVLLFAVQLYCDFSGYTDMATACARLLGYELCRNFDFPYFAGDINDFWRRWHISLSSWFRDYVYIPLGGSRGGRWRTWRNLFVTIFLTGFWHGAAWTFVLFGSYHAVLMILHGEWSRRVPASHPARRVLAALGVPLTFVAVAISMVLFRARSPGDAGVVLRGVLLGDSDGAARLDPRWFVFFAAAAVVHALARRRVLARPIERMPEWSFAMAYGAAAALVWPFVPSSHAPFIYFQF